MEIQYYEHTCLCGCGDKIEIKKSHRKHNIPKYLIGHQNKGKKYTQERKYNISKSLKGKPKSEEHKKKNSESHKGQHVWNKGLTSLMDGRILSGENNPFYGKKHTEYTRQLMKENHADFSGEKHPMYGKTGIFSPIWQGGLSFLPYTPEFNKKLKQKILERDNYECQDPNCEGNHTKLHIHHIDYDKTNSNLENLITLCSSCHSKTNGKNNRQYWIDFYQNIMENKINV